MFDSFRSITFLESDKKLKAAPTSILPAQTLPVFVSDPTSEHQQLTLKIIPAAARPATSFVAPLLI